MWRRRLRLSGQIASEHTAMAAASSMMPRPVSWEWARPRLLPVLARPGFDTPDVPVVRAVTPLGCAVEIGLDLGAAMPVVDGEVARRWECTPAQLLEAALDNLAGRLAHLSQAAVTVGVVRGRLARLLDTPAGLAASVLLLEDQLVRLFGAADQVFLAPSAGLLISFPLSTPPQVIVESALALELDEPSPLLIDPFLMVDGELHWQSGTADDYLSDHQGWRQSGQPGEL